MTAPALISAERSGIYQPPADIAALRARIGGSPLAWFEADLGPVRDKDRMLKVIAEAAGFPADFGANWDALADSLQDLSWAPASGYVLHLRHAAPALRALGADSATLLEILGESAMYWKNRAKAFVVLVDGAQELPAWK